ncbi:MAG: hypothetical protein SVV80_11705 [Planctomycetota bacterium]|nr:hypothetical protein [Planctomycetota bacterium]
MACITGYNFDDCWAYQSMVLRKPSSKSVPARLKREIDLRRFPPIRRSTKQFERRCRRRVPAARVRLAGCA